MEFDKLYNQLMESLQEDAKKCWDGYEKVPGIPRSKQGSCKKKTENAEDSAIKSYLVDMFEQEYGSNQIYFDDFKEDIGEAIDQKKEYDLTNEQDVLAQAIKAKMSMGLEIEQAKLSLKDDVLSGSFDEDILGYGGEEVPEEDAEYRGRKVTLNKPTRGDVKKFKVYVKDPKTGNVKKVNFGHGGTSAKRKGEKTMKIRKSNPKARKSFRARHNCDNPGPKTKARYWSCKKW